MTPAPTCIPLEGTGLGWCCWDRSQCTLLGPGAESQSCSTWPKTSLIVLLIGASDAVLTRTQCILSAHARTLLFWVLVEDQHCQCLPCRVLLVPSPAALLLCFISQEASEIPRRDTVILSLTISEKIACMPALGLVGFFSTLHF